MPPRPRVPRVTAPRSRAGTIRRPRVAGLTPAAGAESTAENDVRPGENEPAGDESSADATSTGSGTPDSGTTGSSTEETAAGEPTSEVDLTKAPAAPEQAGAGTLADRLGLLDRTTAMLAGALVLLLGLAVFFGVADSRLRNSPSAENTALVDVGATSEAAGQLSDALETVYSYDHTRLDENERTAREVITPEFGAQFDQLFAQVRELAPQRQAVVTATVTVSAIQSITDDRAVLVAFMDQQALTGGAPGAAPQQLAAAGRLTVTGERVDGKWKIAAVESR